MEDCIEAYLRKWKVPGISLSITKNGALLYNQAFGFADPRKRKLLPLAIGSELPVYPNQLPLFVFFV